MFAIHFRRDYNTVCDFVVVEEHLAKEDVAFKRAASGDLVIDECTGKVVQEDWWLFEWEKAEPECYARRAQRFDNTRL